MLGIPATNSYFPIQFVKHSAQRYRNREFGVSSFFFAVVLLIINYNAGGFGVPVQGRVAINLALGNQLPHLDIIHAAIKVFAFPVTPIVVLLFNPIGQLSIR